MHVRNPSLQQFLRVTLHSLMMNHIIDGSALVNVLPPRTSKTFEDYATLDVLPTIRAYSIKYERTYIVFDVYRSSSLKTEARSKRGHGARRRVTSICKCPSNWRNFFRDNDNKTDLFNFLADKIEQMPSPNMVIVTKEENALRNHMISLEGVSRCSHEEADTRICIHARQAAQEGSKSLLVKASDTDILVVTIGVMPTLQTIGLQQLWITFDQGRNRWIPAHRAVSLYWTCERQSIAFVHAFTGCDVVSAFRGKGKKADLGHVC